MPHLFVYGTLQSVAVQQRVLGRLPVQEPDVLLGYRRGEIPVSDAAIAARIGSAHYFTLEPHEAARVNGLVLDLDARELDVVDGYERADGFVRVPVTLASGASAWAYVHSSGAARRALDVPGDLRALVERAVTVLRAMPEADTARRPAPHRWCPREILGHLVDSAMVNHGRFLRARWQDDLVFDGYDQDAWVEAHGYAAASWPELVDLWHAVNVHVAHVVERTPEPVCKRVHTRHSLDRIAFRSVQPHEPVTLDLLMQDYVAHLRHHLRQLLGQDWDG